LHFIFAWFRLVFHPVLAQLRHSFGVPVRYLQAGLRGKVERAGTKNARTVGTGDDFSFPTQGVLTAAATDYKDTPVILQGPKVRFKKRLTARAFAARVIHASAITSKKQRSFSQ